MSLSEAVDCCKSFVSSKQLFSRLGIVQKLCDLPPPLGLTKMFYYFSEAACFFNAFSARRMARMATGMASTMTTISMGTLSITGFISSS